MNLISPITTNGDYEFPVIPGVAYLLTLKGTFDGATITMTYLVTGSTYDSINNASWTAPAEQSFRAPSGTMRLTVSSAGVSTSIRVLAIPHI